MRKQLCQDVGKVLRLRSGIAQVSPSNRVCLDLSLAAVLSEERHGLVRLAKSAKRAPGWAGENEGLFEHPEMMLRCLSPVD